jgi:hypothetical protein
MHNGVNFHYQLKVFRQVCKVSELFVAEELRNILHQFRSHRLRKFQPAPNHQLPIINKNTSIVIIYSFYYVNYRTLFLFHYIFNVIYFVLEQVHAQYIIN